MTRRPLFLLLLPLALAVLAGCQDRDLPTSIAPPGPDLLLVSSPNVFIQATVGKDHSCALRGDGVVECWGSNGRGQAPASKSASDNRTFTQVGGGISYTCALRSDGVVECWGSNGWGQAPPIKRAVDDGTFTQVSAASGEHTCALRSDGVVECWGYNGDGQAPPIKRAADDGTFTQVSVGYMHTCALRSDGVVECWGINDGSNYDAGQARVPAELTGVTQVSAGYMHTCALRSNGEAACWGDHDRHGQAPASKSAATGTFTQLSASSFDTCALRSDGVVECWGSNGYGHAPPIKSASDNGTFTQVSVGYMHTCALRSDGVVECWGWTYDGAAPASRSATPYTTRILPTAIFRATPAWVVAGETFTLALDDAQIPNWTGPVAFTYAFDCGDGSGYGAFGASNTASCPTSTAGTRTIKGKVRDHHGDATEYTATVEVLAPQAQTISFTSTPPAPAVVGGFYIVRATATSGLAVTFSSLTPGVCSVVLQFVMLNAAGTCTVAANQAGNTQWQAAPQATQSFTVLQITLGVAADASLTHKTGVATVSGTVTCSTPVALTIHIHLRQEQTKGKDTQIVEGFKTVSVSCSDTTAWTAEVSPASGKFARGTASVAAFVGATPTVQASQTVQLK